MSQRSVEKVSESEDLAFQRLAWISAAFSSAEAIPFRLCSVFTAMQET